MRKLDSFKDNLSNQEMSKILAGTLRHTRLTLVTIEVMDVYDDANDNNFYDEGEEKMIITYVMD
jgi:hypothetical protein